MTIARDWNGADYDRLSTPMEAMGLEVLERLPLRGDETVIDAGCGSGRVTQALLERLPRGRVIGVDGSASMIAAARERLGEDPRLRLVVADLTELDLAQHLGGTPADAILSTATFHWIGDHALLFGRLRTALRDGGRLVAQCGGAGNIAAIHAAAQAVGEEQPYAGHLAGWDGPWRFPAPAETEHLLAAAGFATARAWLEDRPVTPEDPRAYLREINLGAHLEQLPQELRDGFVEAVLGRVGFADASRQERETHRVGFADPSRQGAVLIAYVRLNIDATA